MSIIDEIAKQNKGAPHKPATENRQKKMNGTQPERKKDAKAK